MYDTMDRSAMKALRKRGRSFTEIAKELGCDRRTVAKALEGPLEKKYDSSKRKSQAIEYKEEIFSWFDKNIPVKRMLEMVCEDPENPYEGSRSEFYKQVKKLKILWEKGNKESFIRFEGLPGEYVQIDWGEVRNFPFLQQKPETMYIFAARLKYSRFSYVEFQKDMKIETLIRCILRAFESFEGVPWVATFDNMKTVTTGRDDKRKPIWNETFLKFAIDVDFHPEVCWFNSGNQKGSVEKLVGWVESNFLPGREFLNEQDLSMKCREWVEKINTSVSQAHGKIPAELLKEEQEKFFPLATKSDEYGLFKQVVVGPESLVRIDGTRYSVPVGYIGESLVARIRRHRVEFYVGSTCIAKHQRIKNRCLPVKTPEHFEPDLAKKPRGRVMLYRDFLIEQDQSIKAFIAELCRKYRGAFGDHILKMYKLWQDYGTEELGIACALASEHGAYGADYLVSLLKKPSERDIILSIECDGIPVQEEIDRILSEYESYARGGVC